MNGNKLTECSRGNSVTRAIVTKLSDANGKWIAMDSRPIYIAEEDGARKASYYHRHRRPGESEQPHEWGTAVLKLMTCAAWVFGRVYITNYVQSNCLLSLVLYTTSELLFACYFSLQYAVYTCIYGNMSGVQRLKKDNISANHIYV